MTEPYPQGSSVGDAGLRHGAPGGADGSWRLPSRMRLPDPSARVGSGPAGRGRRRWVEAVWLGLLFVAWTALAYLFPPNGDDWAWGSQIGLHRLHTFFAGYNGRYVADLVIIALTRTPVLAAIVVGAALTATIHLVLAITRNRTPMGYAVVTAVMLAMPHALWSEVISWLSGTVNYMLSTLWVLVFLRSVQLGWRARARGTTPWWRAAVITLFTFAAALFMENVTVFFVVASVVVLVAQRRTFGHTSRSAWCWAAGFVAGAVAMFSNSVYRRAATGGPGYQQMSGATGMFDTFTGQFSQFAVVENMVLNLVVAALITLLAVSCVRRGRGRTCLLPIVPAVASVAIAVPLAVADHAPSLPSWQNLGGAATALLLVALCMAGWMLVAPGSRRTTFLCLVGSSVLLLGPLLVVSPIGPRCFYVTYVLMLAMISILLVELFGRGRRRASARTAASVGALVTLGLFISDFAVYVPMSAAANARVAYVRRQVAQGATSVVVDPLPYPSYTHLPDPIPGRWAHRYKLYYGLPQGLTIRLAPRR